MKRLFSVAVVMVIAVSMVLGCDSKPDIKSADKIQAEQTAKAMSEAQRQYGGAGAWDVSPEEYDKLTGKDWAGAATSSATWLMMIDPSTNKPRPVYIEPEIVVSPFKLNGNVG